MINAEDLASWSNMVDLFTNLNTARKKFNFAQVVPTGGDVEEVYEPTPFQLMNSFISDMKSNRFLKNVDISALKVPDVGDLIKASFMSTFENKISEINKICPHDVSDYSGFFSGGNFTSDHSGFFSGGNFTSDHSGFFSSGNFTSDHSGFFSSGNFTSHHSGFFSSGNFTSHNAFHFLGHKDSEFNAAEYGGHIGGFLASDVGGFFTSGHFSTNQATFFGNIDTM